MALNSNVNILFTNLSVVIEEISNLNSTQMLEVITTFLENPPKEKITFPIILNKEIAGLLHSYDTNNRNADERRTKAICRTVSRDNFEHTHQGIAVAYDDKGTSVVLDGGKRILTAIRMDIPIQTDITFGLSTHVFHAIDQTQPRSTAQTLNRTERRPHVHAQAAAVRAIAKICAGAAVSPSTVDDSEEWRAIFADHLDWAMENFVTIRGLRTAELVAAITVLHRLYPEETEEFGSKLATGTNLKQNDPVLTLRNHLMIAPIKRAGGNNPQLIVLATMNSFLAVIQKTKFSRISTIPTGLNYFREKLNGLQKVRSLIKFWKETGAIEGTQSVSGQELKKIQNLILKDIVDRAVVKNKVIRHLSCGHTQPEPAGGTAKLAMRANCPKCKEIPELLQGKVA